MEIDKRWAAVPILIAIVFVGIVILPSLFGWHINYGNSYGETFKGLTWIHECVPGSVDVKIGTNVSYAHGRTRTIKRVTQISPDGGWVWVMGDNDADGASSGSYEVGWLRLSNTPTPPPTPGLNLEVIGVVDRYISLCDFRSRFERDMLFKYGPGAIHWNDDKKVAAVQDGETVRLLPGNRTVVGHFFKWLDVGSFQIITPGLNPRAFRIGLDGKKQGRIICEAKRVGFVGSGVRAIAFDGFVEVASGDTIILPTRKNLAVKVVNMEYNRLPNEMGMNTVAKVDRDITPTPLCYGEPVQVRRNN